MEDGQVTEGGGGSGWGFFSSGEDLFDRAS
jgi:hypothetical protein